MFDSHSNHHRISVEYTIVRISLTLIATITWFLLNTEYYEKFDSHSNHYRIHIEYTILRISLTLIATITECAWLSCRCICPLLSVLIGWPLDTVHTWTNDQCQYKLYMQVRVGYLVMTLCTLSGWLFILRGQAMLWEEQEWIQLQSLTSPHILTHREFLIKSPDSLLPNVTDTSSSDSNTHRV